MKLKDKSVFTQKTLFDKAAKIKILKSSDLVFLFTQRKHLFVDVAPQRAS